MAALPWYDFAAMLKDASAAGTAGHFFVFCFYMCMNKYGAHEYYDAAAWGRRLAETYCMALLEKFGVPLDDGSYGLYDLEWMLPAWVWLYGAYEHMAAHSAAYAQMASRLGMHVSDYRVWHDIDYLRRFGNRGVHVSQYLGGGRLEADGTSVVAVLRVAASFAAWYLRLSRL